MSQLTIHLFGQLTDIAGSDRIQMPLVADTDELMNALLVKYPGLKSITFLVAVDKKIIRNNISLPSNAEIALLPPFSGG